METGNSFGRYATEEEALAVVRTPVHEYGPAFADELHLGIEHDDGRFDEPLSGAALLARLGALAPS